MTREFRYHLSALARNIAGVSAVEFALLITPFMLLLMGALDMGHTMYVRGVAQGALDDVARRASVESATVMSSGSDPLKKQIEDAIKDQIGPVAPNAVYDITQSSYYDFSGVGKPEPIVKDKNSDGQYTAADGDCFEDTNDNGVYNSNSANDGIGGASDIAFYEVHIVMPRLFPFYNFIGASPDLDFTVKTAVRNQPYAEQIRPDPKVRCGV